MLAELYLYDAPPVHLPTVNAGLNTLCTLLLLAGYAAIRAKRVSLHRTLMVTAFATSCVFLASYLYHHLVIAKGQPTRYPGDGWDRTAYLGILLTHTVLAVAVAVLAPTTLWLGLTNRWATHRKVARWTFPIWLYVSVTGVVVYVMLYRPV